MIVQFPQIYIDRLVSIGLSPEDIYRGILLSSQDDEERKDLEFFELFIGDMLWMNDLRDYPVHFLSDSNQ